MARLSKEEADRKLDEIQNDESVMAHMDADPHEQEDMFREAERLFPQGNSIGLAGMEHDDEPGETHLFVAILFADAKEDGGHAVVFIPIEELDTFIGDLATIKGVAARVME